MTNDPAVIDPVTSDRVRLADWPTPVEPAPRLAAAVGLDPDALSLKRDDLTGLGAGGNKVRKRYMTMGISISAFRRLPDSPARRRAQRLLTVQPAVNALWSFLLQPAPTDLVRRNSGR